jgi:hypothetical protein
MASFSTWSSSITAAFACAASAARSDKVEFTQPNQSSHSAACTASALLAKETGTIRLSSKQGGGRWGRQVHHKPGYLIFSYFG